MADHGGRLGHSCQEKSGELLAPRLNCLIGIFGMKLYHWRVNRLDIKQRKTLEDQRTRVVCPLKIQHQLLRLGGHVTGFCLGSSGVIWPCRRLHHDA